MPNILFDPDGDGPVDTGESFGQVHTLIVRELGEPAFDGLRDITDYEIVHPGCPVEQRSMNDGYVTYEVFTCDVGFQEADGDLAFSLKYSGTEITQPGTYRIQAWSRKECSGPDFITEYDAGIGVVQEET